MPIVNTSGTLTADGTVQTVCDVTDNKFFTFKIDTAAMDDGDITVLKVYDVVLNAGALSLQWQETWANAQVEPLKFVAPLWITEEIKITLEQTDGTNRAYPWVLLEA